MSTSLVSRQWMWARAAVLLATLVVVPLFAALGTSPSQWFVVNQSSSAIFAQQPHATNAPPHSRADSNPAAHNEANHAHESSAIAGEHRADAQANPSVLRRWSQNDAAPPAASESALELPSAATRAAEQPPFEFHQIEKQLRELGATYYLLEHWSTDGPLYRFHCRMSINELKHYNRHFEAVATDPVDAMHNVLEQVRRWREPFTKPP